MATVIGLGGARRNAATALCVDGDVVAVCEQERLTRNRRVGLPARQLPQQAIDCVLRLGNRRPADVSGYAAAERTIALPAEYPLSRFDHHFAHAATAFWSSPFDEAVVLICDRHSPREVTVWQADAAGIRESDLRWSGPGFASVYSRAAAACGFEPGGDEHRLESLARLGSGGYAGRIHPLVRLIDDRLEVDNGFDARIAEWAAADGSRPPLPRGAELAGGIQHHLGDLLLDLLRRIKRELGGANLCLGGGLFYNSYFTTSIAASGIYRRTFVPVNPGNAGVAVGAALAAAGAPKRPPQALSPFLGPEYDPVEIKQVLDNCKVSYEYVRNGQLIDRTAHALARGQLVGWFQGRMEWGARALGNRSILASPVAPYTLENLNAFLKHREAHRTYSVAVCREDLDSFFAGPGASPFMEFEYEVLDRDRFRALLPPGITRLRVQTVDDQPHLLRPLLKAFGEITGVPVLVNTSFNGFHEPIVCSPRDAVRVFYGTGLDLACIGDFVLHK